MKIVSEAARDERGQIACASFTYKRCACGTSGAPGAVSPTGDGAPRATLRFLVEVSALKNLPNAMLERGVAAGGAEPEQTAFALIDQCLAAAVQLGASDIHIEPQADKLVFRLRVDGQLKIWKELPIEVHAQVMGRLKVMARLDISEKRRPQDGRFTQTSQAGVRDYRIAIAPMLEGEKAVIRVLHHDLSKLNIKTVGYSEHNLKVYQEQLSKPHGLLLHCGPTGSGKTTALYAAINHLSKVSRNVQTIEDPVEGRLPGVNQAQVNSEIGVTFASFLRSYLRQDCDVILVGEIRDPETAQLALQASMTGHLVLGTLHTNTAAGAIGRLCDMGVPPFFIAGALIGTVSQRLVRKLCKHCRQPVERAARDPAPVRPRPDAPALPGRRLPAVQQARLPRARRHPGDLRRHRPDTRGDRGAVDRGRLANAQRPQRDAQHVPRRRGQGGDGRDDPGRGLPERRRRRLKRASEESAAILAS